jgi:hypothetical protein
VIAITLGLNNDVAATLCSRFLSRAHRFCRPAVLRKEC